MKKIAAGTLLFTTLVCVFAQVPAGGSPAEYTEVNQIREYVGLISISDHPNIIAFTDRIKEELENDETLFKKKPEMPKKSAPKEPPYERPSGSGFLFKADDGNTYILTNWHVISNSWNYSITLEKFLEEKTVYSGLILLAADEENDLALLSFAPGKNPGRDGLPLLERPVRDGEEVFSAGFPALGRDPVWQLGRGHVSNSRVMFHTNYEEDDETMEGPFIQHTSQIDPGNSGGPLLVADASSLSGFTVAGINVRSARWRQAANYSIPVTTVRSFLDRAFNPLPDKETGQKKLDERITAFMDEVKTNRYSIFDWITYQCFLDNYEYAYYWASLENPRYIKNFTNSPMNSIMGAFTVLARDAIPPPLPRAKYEAAVKSVEEEENAYRVIFLIKEKEISSLWVKEHGTWRIASIGKINGEAAKIVKAQKLYNNQRKIRSGSNYKLFNDITYYAEGGYVSVIDRGGAFYGALGASNIGIRCVYADKDYWQAELFGRGYLTPLRFSVFALETNLGLGIGIKNTASENKKDTTLYFGISPWAGMELTSSAIPGLYIGAAYQYNFYYRNSNDMNNTRHLFIFYSGYRFKN